jgi:hypothetical protein
MMTVESHSGDMMPSADMNAVHVTIGQMMQGAVDDDLLAACVTASIEHPPA